MKAATTEGLFEAIAAKTVSSNQGVAPGKMMTAPALKFKGKVFAFYWEEKMGFKLGKDRDLATEFSIADFEFLSPFKNKPPMTAWYMVGAEYQAQWEALTLAALKWMVAQK